MPMGRDLGTRTGQYWAYQAVRGGEVQRGLVLHPGFHFGDDVRVRLVDDPAVTELWADRARLVCRWQDLEAFLLAHPDIPQTYGPVPAPAEPPDGHQLAFTANELRAIIHDELSSALGGQKIAYSYKEAAIAVGLSTSALRAAVAKNYLAPRFYGRRALFPEDELRRFVGSLPEQPRRIS